MKDGRIYGRGVSDMKAGIAASIIATTVLAEHRDVWSGEIVITLAGDEESMGTFGTQYLLDNVEKARGDAVVCGDVGSPKVIRFGEKGLVWFEIMATGKAAHGAHVHKGKSAIDLLRSALDLVKKLENLPVQMPLEISQAIASASALSESMSGEGESETLRTVTVNIGPISGGVSPNLVASEAKAQGDIRLPVGMSTQQIIDHLNEWLDPIEGISWRALQRYEPSYTSPSHDIILCAMAASEEVMNEKPVANMRVGASDTRLYRAAGIPSVVLGCTPNNMGVADEYVVVDELLAVAKIHALIAYDFLNMAT
jgi:acetylornithine deacetylase/succinyl-diaminopimelate desuccinylase-like protein